MYGEYDEMKRKIQELTKELTVSTPISYLVRCFVFNF